MQGGFQGGHLFIAVGVRPENIGQFRLAHLTTAQGNDRLQKLNRTHPGKGFVAQCFVVPGNGKPAQGEDPDRPGPVVKMHGRTCRNQVPVADTLADKIHLDLLFKGGSGDRFHHFRNKEEEMQVIMFFSQGKTMPELINCPFSVLSAQIQPCHPEMSQAGEPGIAG